MVSAARESEPGLDQPAAPDWATIGYEVYCPLCEYNLRGLSTPRCPECGYPFTWPEMLTPSRADHPYLFEHHPGRGWRTFWRTAWGACRPRRFWSSLHPGQRSRPKRLLFYWASGMLALWLVSLGLIVTHARVEAYQIQLNWGGQVPDTWTILTETVLTGEAGKYYRGVILPLAVGVSVLWTWLTVASLMVFQFSMRRARVRSVHMLRCVLYSFDLVPSAALFLIGAIIMAWTLNRDWAMVRGLYVVIGLAAVHGSWRLWHAVKSYLRFDRPLATVVASQVIVFLSVLALLCTFDREMLWDLFVLFFRM